MKEAGVAPPGVMPIQQPTIAAADRGHPVSRQLLPGLRAPTSHVDLRARALEGKPLLHGEEDLADAEQADHGDEEVEAAQELGRAEGHAQLPGHRVEADRGEREAEHHRGDAP